MKRADKIRIVVADDRPIVLYGLQSWFESHERFSVAACVRNASQLFARLNSAKYDLIVLSSCIEGLRPDHVALLRELRQTFPDTPVVAFTNETAASRLADLQLAGAAGLISMREEARAFERVCDRVLSGASQVVSPRIAASCDAGEAPGSFDVIPDYRDVRVRIRPSPMLN